MSIQVDFYTFSKRPNSTKKPTTTAVSHNCNLIEPTNISAPAISLNIGTSENPCSYNYAFVRDFKRYYFISDWSYARGLWVANLNVDVLSSFKESIGASSQYVLRSAATYDENVVDTLYPAKCDTVTTISEVDVNPFFSSLDHGTYIVGIINGDANAMGAVSYYAFSNSQFRQFCNEMLNTISWFNTDIVEISEELLKTLFNPFQYIVSCMWFPFTSVDGVEVDSMSYGWWNLKASCKRITKNTVRKSCNFTIPKHPQDSRGKYLNRAPFSSYRVVWPVIGTIPLDDALIYNFDTLTANITTDLLTGKAVVTLNAINNVLYCASTQIGVPVQIAQVNTDVASVGKDLATAVGGVFSWDLDQAFSSVGSAIQNAAPKVQTSGSNGSTSAFDFAPVLEADFSILVDENNSQLGRPLCKTYKISEIPGYIKTAKAELSINGFSAEMEEICSIMNGGFFYE